MRRNGRSGAKLADSWVSATRASAETEIITASRERPESAWLRLAAVDAAVFLRGRDANRVRGRRALPRGCDGRRRLAGDEAAGKKFPSAAPRLGRQETAGR